MQPISLIYHRIFRTFKKNSRLTDPLTENFGKPALSRPSNYLKEHGKERSAASEKSPNVVPCGSLLAPCFLVISLLLASLIPFTGCGKEPPGLTSTFGNLDAQFKSGQPTPAALGPYLALARAVLAGQDAAAISLEHDTPGRRVYLLVHKTGEDRLAASAYAPALSAAVTQAATLLRPLPWPLEDVRIQLDVTTAARHYDLPEKIEPKPHNIGMIGYTVRDNDSHFGFILPSEIIYDEVFEGDKKKTINRKYINKVLAKRSNVKVSALAQMYYGHIETVSVVESSPPGRVLPLVRGIVRTDAPVTAEGLLAANRRGADYLVRVLNEHGRYIYNYKAISDKNGAGYNILRHAGSTYALLEAAEAFDEPSYLEAGARALRYLTTRIQPRPGWIAIRPGHEDFVHILDEEKGEQSKVGAAGLSLLAMAKYSALTKNTEFTPTMLKIAHFIRHMQEENGHFISYFQYRQDVVETQKEVLYYPGEAMLGLLRLYALDPNPLWIETARRGADYLIHTRDGQKSENALEHDHWLSMALNELYRITRHEPYAEHAFKIGRAIMQSQKTKSSAAAPDFIGSFYKRPNSTPASVRLEAYAADITLARFMGRSDWELLESAKAVAAFVQSQQFDADNSFFIPNPKKAMGGVRESVVKNDIQIDYVQHAMSGMLGLARVLQDPDFGRKGVPAVISVTPFND